METESCAMKIIKEVVMNSSEFNIYTLSAILYNVALEEWPKLADAFVIEIQKTGLIKRIGNPDERTKFLIDCVLQYASEECEKAFVDMIVLEFEANAEQIVANMGGYTSFLINFVLCCASLELEQKEKFANALAVEMNRNPKGMMKGINYSNGIYTYINGVIIEILELASPELTVQLAEKLDLLSLENPNMKKLKAKIKEKSAMQKSFVNMIEEQRRLEKSVSVGL